MLVTGATGYLGRPLVALAAARGHRVRAFVRPGSEPKVPAGVEIARGDALVTRDLIAALSEGDTPAPMIHAYIAVRQQGEVLVRATGIPATIFRPWYVLGPGHWWPYALAPVYWLAECIPPTRATARRLGLVTHKQMITAMMSAIERGPEAAAVIDVPSIRAARLPAASLW